MQVCKALQSDPVDIAGIVICHVVQVREALQADPVDIAGIVICHAVQVCEALQADPIDIQHCHLPCAQVCEALLLTLSMVPVVLCRCAKPFRQIQ